MSGFDNDSALAEYGLTDNTEQDQSSSNSSYYPEDDGSIPSALKIKSKIDLSFHTIKIEDIVTSEFKKISRQDTIIGLTGVVGEWGVVNPIHVLKLEDDDLFMMLDGLRRVFGALRSGKSEIWAIVWDFSDPEEGKEMANVLSLMINRSQKFKTKELWEQMQILEEANAASPGFIEYLLQLNSGDAMKLKDVMLSDIEYSDIREDLMQGMTTIDGAYRKLCNERKKENRLAKEDHLVIESTGGSGEDDISDEQQLSVDEVKDLLDLTSTDVGESTLDDLDRSAEARGGEQVQDPKDRQPLDANLKKAVMVRDNFKCRCCGIGGEQWLSILVCHHVIEVVQGGPDTVDNLVTLCINCHITLHNYAWGKIYVKLDELDEKEKQTFKSIFKFGNIIIEADKRIGRSKEQAMKEGRASVRSPFPGEGLKDNKEAFAGSQTA